MSHEIGMPAVLAKCTCIQCTWDLPESGGVLRNGLSYCSKAYSAGQPNNEPGQAVGAYGSDCSLESELLLRRPS